MPVGDASGRADYGPAAGRETALPPEARPIYRSPAMIAILGLASVGMFVAAMVWPADGAFWGPGVSAGLAWTLFFVHVFASRKLLNPFDLVIWIPVVFLLQYMGMAMTIEWFGFASPTGYDGYPVGREPHPLELGFVLGALCPIALLFGVHLTGLRDLSKPQPAPVYEKRSILPAALVMFWGGILMTAIGIPIVGVDLLFGNYGDRTLANVFGRADFRLFQSGMLFWQAAIYGLIACYRKGRPGLLVLAYSGAAALVLMLLLSGDRGGLSSIIFGVGFVTMLRVRRLPHWVVVASFVGAVILMPAIGEWRQGSEVESMSLIDAINVSLYQMGGAIQPFAWSLEMIPSIKGYTWGTTYLAQLVNNIPNLGLTLGPGLWIDYDPMVHLPGYWYNGVMNPYKQALQGGGWAYAYGAEFYFNWGIPGILIGQVFTGWITAKARNAALSSTFKLTMACLYLSMMAIAVRNAIGYPLRTALWPLIGLAILYWLLPQRERLKPFTQQPSSSAPAPAAMPPGAAARSNQP